MRNVGKVMRLDTAMWSFRIRIWQLMGLMDILLLVLALLGISEELAFFASFTAMLTILVIIRPFFSNQKYGIDGLLATFPFQKREIVIGHFMYGLFWTLILNINAMVGGVVAAFLLHVQSIVKSIILPYLGLMMLLILLLIIFYLFIISFGFRHVQIMLCIVAAVVGIAGMYFLPITIAAIFASGGWLMAVKFGISALTIISILLISMWLSIKLYNRKEI